MSARFGAMALLLVLGCDEQMFGSEPKPVPTAVSDKEQPGERPLRVDLPAVPDLSGPQVPLLGPDGTPTIWGLSQRTAQWKHKTINVQAHVVGVYLCAEPIKTRPPCDAAHFFVADTPDGKPYRMLVAGYDPEDEATPEPEVGAHVQIEALFDTSNEQGFVASQGMLRMVSWKKYEPASAPTQPATP